MRWSRLRYLASRFHRDTQAAVLAETIVVVPFVTLFSVGILEFGNMLWQKEQIEIGLRDAARYLARCQRAEDYSAECSASIARNIAYYGTPTPLEGALSRVPGWSPGAEAITFTEGAVIRAATAHVYRNSPLFGWLGLDLVTIQAYHEERYLGW